MKLVRIIGSSRINASEARWISASGALSMLSTGAQTNTIGLVVQVGQAVSSGYTVSTLPTGVTGGRAHVTDATTCTLLGALTGGGSTVCPVFFNGSAWVGG
jgi:hypothetical protein